MQKFYRKKKKKKKNGVFLCKLSEQKVIFIFDCKAECFGHGIVMYPDHHTPVGVLM